MSEETTREESIHVVFTASERVFRYSWRGGRLISADPRLHPGPHGWTRERAPKGWRRHVRRMKAKERATA